MIKYYKEEWHGFQVIRVEMIEDNEILCKADLELNDDAPSIIKIQALYSYVRRKGYAKQLMNDILTYITINYPDKSVYLKCNRDGFITDFYKRFNFEFTGFDNDDELQYWGRLK